MAENYRFKKGDCLECVAQERGMVGGSVWNNSENSAIRGKRKSPGKLMPDDVIVIPDPRPKDVYEATDRVHKFQLKKGPHEHWIEIELVDDDDKPVGGIKYRVEFSDGTRKEGSLDQKGWARVEGIPKTSCEVTFPELDREAWKFIEKAGPKQ